MKRIWFLYALLVTPLMAEPDFTLLAEKTFLPDGQIDREAGDRLWSALYKLPQWYFLMTPRSAAKQQPSVQSIDSKPWMLVVTDPELLRKYAAGNGNLDAGGKALYLAMTPDQAVSYLSQFADSNEVFGVRFNEGARRGWFAPVRNLMMFPGYLKKKGLL